MLYTAFIADMVNSKKLLKEDREQIQIYIKDCLGVLNNIFKPSLKFEVIFSAGDEVQGLFKSPTAAFLYLRLLKMLLSPLRIRCGTGVGEWEVKIPDGTSAEQDGTAYHKARDAISITHDRKGCNFIFNSGNENDIVINTLANTSFLFSVKQSRYQSNILLLTELMNPIFDSNLMDLNSFGKMSALIGRKSNLEFYRNPGNSVKNDMNLFKEIQTGNDPFDISASPGTDNKLTLKETLKKGISAKISNITGTSRQNMDNVIKTANIPEIRELDVVTLLLINKVF